MSSNVASRCISQKGEEQQRRHSEAGLLRLAALARFFFCWCSLEGATIAFFLTPFSATCSMDSDVFWCLFRPGGCLWSLRGCPFTPEAARVSFWDAFWSHLELLLGGLGDHFWTLSVLVSQCVFGAASEPGFV